MKRMLSTILMTIGLSININTAIAGIPVFDATSLAETIKTIQELQQQRQVIQNQLNQLEREFDAMTGSRGLANLINSQYDTDVLSGIDVDAILRQNNLKSANEYGMSGEIAALHDASNNNAATYSEATSKSLSQSQARFNELSGLIAKVNDSNDPKEIMDLQARISAEQAFLLNEQAKILTLQQQAEANQILHEQQIKQMAIESAGEVPQFDW